MNSHLHKTMFIDIETVPAYKTYAELSTKMQELWAKKSKQIAKEEEDYAKTYENNAGIFAEFGKIMCVCMGYFTDKNLTDFKVKSFASHDEKEILNNVFSIFNKFFNDNTFTLCGHNIKEFDVPYICRRALINGIAMPNFLKDLQNKKPWENTLIDTLHNWRFGDYKHYITLDLLATILGINTPKDDIDGSQVANVYWQENDIERIATYCSKDVVTTAQVLLRLQNLPLLSENNIAFL